MGENSYSVNDSDP